MLDGYSVPVRLDVGAEAYMQGIYEITGLLSYTDGAVHLDYQPGRLAYLGPAKAPPTTQSASFPLRDLGAITYHQHLFGSKIVLRPMRLETLADLPGYHAGELNLRVRRRHRRHAAALVSHIRLALSELRLNES